MHNLKLAFRTLFKTPFVTGVAIVSLALGIGANAAIFSLFNQMLLQALPVPEPERLVNLGAPGPKPGSHSCNQAGDCDDVFSYPMFRDLERVQTGLHRHRRARRLRRQPRLQGPDAERRGHARVGQLLPACSASSPRSAGCSTPDDDRNVGGHFVVVLSHATGRRSSIRIPNVLNETLIVNGQAMTIVGVAPRGLRRHDARHRGRRCSCRSRCAA